MKKKLQILHLEDNKYDAEIIENILHEGKIECDITYVTNQNDYKSLLRQIDFDLIISDFSMPGYDGLSALRYAKEYKADIPFIFLSGTIGEDRAVAALRNGARDYVHKQHLDKLIPTVNRLVNESEIIRSKIKTENELRESEEKYRNLVDNALVGVYETNLTGDILFANKILLGILGFNSMQDLKGLKIVDKYADPSEREKFINILKKDGIVTNFEVDLIIGGNDIAHTLLSARLQDDKINGMILDVTEKKKAEIAMKEAKEKAEEMNRLKSNFLANMSHELRTPLIGILGYAEFLEDEIQDKKLSEMVKVIKNSGNRLNRTLNNILDISKIESENLKINLEVSNLRGYLKEQIDLFKLAAEEKGLSLTFVCNEGNLNAKVDELLFTSIIDNLLNNAIKYTKEGAIELKAKGENNFVVIEVIDSGIGIPEDSQAIIFEPFRQVSEGYTRNYEGVGLGLSIVKKCTDMMGGTISVKSKTGKGSTFTLKLPKV